MLLRKLALLKPLYVCLPYSLCIFSVHTLFYFENYKVLKLHYKYKQLLRTDLKSFLILQSNQHTGSLMLMFSFNFYDHLLSSVHQTPLTTADQSFLTRQQMALLLSFDPSSPTVDHRSPLLLGLTGFYCDELLPGQPQISSRYLSSSNLSVEN